MENIQKWKGRGNEFFKLNNHLKAINCWEEALAAIKGLEYDQQQAAIKDKASEVSNELNTLKAQLNGNLSLGHLKRDEIDEAEFYNSTCLSYDPENIKANFRLIQIHLARKEYQQAQMFAIKCVSKFKKDQKVFKDILIGEIAQKLREQQNSDEIE